MRRAFRLLVRALVAAMLCAIMGAGTSAQTQMQGAGAAPVTKTMLMEPPSPLLPVTLGNLKRVAEGDVGDGLDHVDAADSPVLTEDGLRRFARSQYSGGQQHGTITVYRFADVSGAVSAYDYFRRPGMRPEKLGDDALSSGDELLLRSGANVAVANLMIDHEAMLALTRELIAHLPKTVGAASVAPLLPSLLTDKLRTGVMVADSVRYALGPAGYKAMGGVLPPQAVGFDKSAEALTARNRSGGALTLLLYPTPEIAGEHEREFAALCGHLSPANTQTSPQATTHTSTQALTSQTAPLGLVKMRREGTLLLLTTGTWPQAEAVALLNGIHLRQEVTWDKPVPLDFETELHKTYSLLVSIVILSGIGCLAALLLGLFLGYGRALIRVMQGKPAASEPEFLRIDLSGAVGKKLRGPEE